MRSIAYLSLVLIGLFVAACQSNGSQEGTDLESKKTALKQKMDELQKLNLEIKHLENEIKAMDSSFLANGNAILVNLTEPVKKTFKHFIEVRGSVESQQNVTIAAQTSGEIVSVNAEEGDIVKAGQLLLSIDAEIISKNMKEVKTSLELATKLYEKQENLWKQNIGTEIQYLQAKNNKETLESRLASLQAQLRMARVTAPFTGKVDRVFAKEGEIALPGSPLVRIVSMNQLSIRAEVADRYIGKMAEKDSAGVYIPSLDLRFNSVIKSIGEVINDQNRTFTVEVAVPAKYKLNPNQVAILTLKDYDKEDALVVPANLILEDNKGDYMYIAKEGADGWKANKVHVTRSQTYKNEALVTEGINFGDKIIKDGYREVSDGTIITIAN